MQTSAFVSEPGAFRIRAADHAAALTSLQRGCPKHMVIADYLQNPEEFASTRYLARAFELLGTQCDVDGGDLVLVPFASSESVDLSAYYWDFIETLAHEENPGSLSEGSKLAMIEAGEDVDDEQDARHHASEAADDFISEMGDRKITLAELDAVIASEGSVDFCDYNGDTPLLAASTSYRWAISARADAQMDGDTDTDDGDDDDDDPEEEAYAAQEWERNVHNLHTVLQRCPDMGARNRDGLDALGLAAESGSVEFVDLLMAHGATVNAGALQGAVRSLSLDMVRKLAQHHAHLAGPDLLVGACSAYSIVPGKLEMVRYLVEELGCDVNARATKVASAFKGPVGRLGTALMAAALTDDLALVQYLLSAGADLHAADAYGNTALHYCSGQTWVNEPGGGTLWFALDDNPKLIDLLRSHGADDGARNVAGRAPADLCASRRPHGPADEADEAD
ncbi:ankyrin repeat domain-containing protein [Acidovorax sp. 106]|uniref:ankyrin repeat domain-containing protein n=1 Tax=Acidovorax sp. 106 TaxID=2135637 RepID=UPI000EB5D48C|nr:ankyrin repeat domain-containing protein [Acidovorax sp. 106]RLJ39225.1 ankyrin repeat protein [Acidovorax sp. 106]